MPLSSPSLPLTERLPCAAITALSLLFLAPPQLWAEIAVSPQRVALARPEDSQQLLVTETANGNARDLTRSAKFAVLDPAIARVDADGLIQPLADGETTLTIQTAAGELKVPIQITGIKNPAPVSFEHEILPILTKARCNSGGCHGKAEGQNGFKLSLLGFDGRADYDALIKEGRSRRISLAAPQQSLLLRKASAEIPHGGGLKIPRDGPQYKRLVRWLATGAPYSVPDERPAVSIEVEPAELVMQTRERRQLRVTAIDAEGNRRCVTVETEFISNAGQIVEANSRGLLESGANPGEAAILIRYLGHVTVCRVVVPRAAQSIVRPAEHNFIDKLVWDKLVKLGIQPSPLASDAVFLRRVYLDTIGTLPTAAEARRFLTDPSPDKRSKLIDEILNRPEYADYWAMKWSDILRADKVKVTHQGTIGLTRWLRKQFAANRPFDEMAREIVTAQGPVQSESPAAFFRAADQPEVASRLVSQLFLGVRIECAQCHHHPSERWGQDDYAALAGFFTGVSIKKLPDGSDSVVSRGGTDVKHPRSGEPVAARALGAKPAEFAGGGDRRQVLAAWMTGPENRYFARTIANRTWGHYVGRGIVEPIDDMRATNPPTNEPLLDALATHLRDAKFDLKVFTRTLLNSRVYQLSAETNESNRDDRHHFSHAWPKALPAEVLLDAVSQVTGVGEKFNGWPAGMRSIHVWDNRMPSYFFRIFGRPVRNTVCECERSNEPSISQALHLLNSPELHEKIASRQGVARQLADSARKPAEIIAEIYLGALARFPSPAEETLMLEAFAAPSVSRRQAAEDVLWSVLNTKEFIYND